MSYTPQTTWANGVHPLAPELMRKKTVVTIKKPKIVASRPQRILDALEAHGTLTSCQLSEVLDLPKVHVRNSLKMLNKYKTKRVLVESRLRLKSSGMQNFYTLIPYLQ